jgi:hypothetical protein
MKLVSFFNSEFLSIYVKKFLIYLSAFVILSLYFILTIFILPSEFLMTEQLVPEPSFTAILSKTNIALGDSFRLDIVSMNNGDYADIHIVSVAFPDLSRINDVVKITTYDFTLSPSYIYVDDEIGSKYSGGVETTLAQYPSIEAMSRPLKPDVTTHFDLLITPQELGIFNIYVKSIGIPHTSDLSHYPYSGILDHQNEYVSVYSVTVNP